ncbi:hypothetical protein FD428_05405 [Citrobacter sp. TBCP-5362]|uniref:hypothetical protein n=1 Tax=Citrobacter TaxID=544 RepID=UPI000E09E811|nr:MULTISPECIES: hypothetical protein [Citrobacter]MBJ9174147.1 hypothetical protein [Citrobacter koseri]QCQ70467.1 hypothetical protein FD428_05405 [Citrobacter sp. TBCP-5362]WQD98649.1 hypothetical protein U0009_05355 [Citrobacter koseri]SUX84360.1 Uncharacterised protein [Citrobacter koseri]HEM6674175.1 hypothetical protein [Citrobacter koseri]
MGTHAFADMMYRLYQCFGLFEKDDERREVRGNSSFSFHQNFFDQGYNDVIRIIDSNEVFSLEERREVFYKYEQLYNALMHIPVFSHLDNRQITKRYLQVALPPIVALDVYNSLYPDDEMHFYYHIHHFLISTHCPHESADKRKIYSGVKQYLREYIRTLDFHYTDHLASLINFINNIKASSGQKEATIKRVIKNCRSEYNESYISEKNIKVNSLNLNKIEKAYLSLNVLLAFERKTSAVTAVSMHYRHTVNNGINYNNSYGILCRYIYSKGYDEKLLHYITLPFYNVAVRPVSVTIEKKAYRYVHELKWLIFNTRNTTKYSKWDLAEIASCFKSASNSDVLIPYSQLLQTIIFLSQGKTDEAFRLVNKIPLTTLPIGYLPSAFSVIKLALKVKLERKKIRNKTLLSVINSTLSNQGAVTELIAVTQGETDSNLALCADNMTIMRAIKMYNHMIRKVSYSFEGSLSDVCPQSIFGILDEIECALGKLNILIRETGDSIDSNELAKLIVKNKTLTARELNENLVGILDKCTLYNFLSSINVFINYLRCPGEELGHIRILVGATEKPRRLREKICEALKIASEKSR